MLLAYVPIPTKEWEEEQKLRQVIKELVQAVSRLQSHPSHPPTVLSLAVLYRGRLASAALFLHLPNLFLYLYPSRRGTLVDFSGNCLDSSRTCAMIPSSQMILANKFSVRLSSFPI